MENDEILNIEFLTRVDLFKVFWEIFQQICGNIKDKGCITDEDTESLYLLHGDAFLNALRLIDDNAIEKVTITNTIVTFYCVHDAQHSYVINSYEPRSCRCNDFKENFLKMNYLCKHIIACFIGNALGNVKQTTANDIYNFDSSETDFKI